MRIASFNSNNINRRLLNLLAWLRETEPGVVSLQELKATDAEFPVKVIQEAGYKSVWRGQKSWNGVAIPGRWAPIFTRAELPGDSGDTQSRYIEAARARAVPVNRVITVFRRKGGNWRPSDEYHAT